MATKKKAMVAKAPKAKRPPKQVWLMFAPDGEFMGGFTTKRQADSCLAVYARAGASWFVAGPYVLAERVAQR